MHSYTTIAALVLLTLGFPAVSPGSVDAELAPAQVKQGGLFLVTITCAARPVRLEATFEGKELSFFPSPILGVFRALGGVGVNARPGPRRLVVHGLDPYGERFSNTLTVTVVPGHFAREELKVAPRMAKPNRQALERVARERKLVQTLTSRVTESKLAGAFVRPVRGSVSSPFGRCRTFNGSVRSRHLGVDLRAATGTPIRASNAGTVVLAGELYYAGNVVMMDHGMGLFTLYAHLSRVAVREGDVVNRGLVVGLAGATGRVTGPHLHWGLKLGGHDLDPLGALALPLLPSAGGPGSVTALVPGEGR